MPSGATVRLKRLQQRAVALLDEKQIGGMDHSQLSRLEKAAQFWGLVVSSFIRNRAPARASALAYTTLLALIPLLAIALSITTSMLTKEGGKPLDDLINKLVTNVAPALNLQVKADGGDGRASSQEVSNRIKEYITNIRSGTLNVTSVIALVFVAISLLRTIEATFNDIWAVTHGRSWGSSIVRYWAAISLGPLVLVVVIGLMTKSHVASTKNLIATFPVISRVILSLLPFVVLSLAFAVFYQLIPNTRVQWKAALAGGAVSGCLWHLNNMFSIIYLSNVVTYSKIYGSLGIIPLFLVGLYLSWLILLFGAQVAYAFQNRQTYLQEKQAELVHQRGRELIALRLMTFIGQSFQDGRTAPTLERVTEELAVPTYLASQILCALVDNDLLLEVSQPETGFAPKRPLDRITCYDILRAMRVGKGKDLEMREEATQAIVTEQFERIYAAEQAVAASATLANLVQQSQRVEAQLVESAVHEGQREPAKVPVGETA